jgi:hypothetical protein
MLPPPALQAEIRTKFSERRLIAIIQTMQTTVTLSEA